MPRVGGIADVNGLLHPEARASPRGSTRVVPAGAIANVHVAGAEGKARPSRGRAVTSGNSRDPVVAERDTIRSVDPGSAGPGRCRPPVAGVGVPARIELAVG